MGSKRIYNVALTDLIHYISLDKIVPQNIEFNFYTRSKTRSPYGYHQWQSTYILHNQDTVDNLFLTLKAIRYDEFDYYSFMLSYKYLNQVNIIHQLEIYPDWKNSHTETDGQKLYGSHIHELHKTYEVRPDGYTTFDWRKWLFYYTNLTNITLQGKITAPYDGELF